MTLIESQLRLLSSEQVGDNGVIFFFGIDHCGHEITEIILPPNPVTEFYYQCNRRFETERFLPLFKIHAIGHVIFISGQECIIYQYHGSWSKLKTINANLIKRHNKGGQSSVRFSRLAEESRAQYVTHVIDWLNRLIQTPERNHIYGSRELKEMLLTHNGLKIPLQTEDRYHIFDHNTIHEEYFQQLMTTQLFIDSDKIELIIELLEKDPDYLLFTLEEIEEHSTEVEFIVDVGHLLENAHLKQQVIKLPWDHPLYHRLHEYPLVAKLYYKGENTKDLW